MRIVSYQSVYEGFLDRAGFDPAGDAVTHEIARSFNRNVNQRLKIAWEMWPFPELMLTEERAFRSIWNDTRQFRRTGEDGLPDEFYYLGDDDDGTNSGYYKVAGSAVSDPPIGTLPTHTNYFEVISAPTPFVARDQVCRRAIGVVRGVYRTNPGSRSDTAHWWNGENALPFRPSERGVMVRDWNCVETEGVGTVFVWYSLPVSQFSMVPYVVGRTYQRGDTRFDPTTGECFQALASTTAIPADTFFWRRVPFPAMLADYAEAGAYADYAKGSKDPAEQSKAALADAEATMLIQHEIDLLLAQGQKHYYTRPFRNGLWSREPWGGDRVIELTPECQDELGFIYPVVTTVPAVAWQYRPDVRSLRTTAVALNSLPTVNLISGSICEIIIDEEGARTMMNWELVTGPADATDPNGHVAPLDYSVSSNNKHWERRS